MSITGCQLADLYIIAYADNILNLKSVNKYLYSLITGKTRQVIYEIKLRHEFPHLAFLLQEHQAGLIYYANTLQILKGPLKGAEGNMPNENVALVRTKIARLENRDLQPYLYYATHYGYVSVIDWVYKLTSQLPEINKVGGGLHDGYVDLLKWILALPSDSDESVHFMILLTAENLQETSNICAANGHLEMCKFLFVSYDIFPQQNYLDGAIGRGHLNILEWYFTVTENTPIPNTNCLLRTAAGGHLDVLVWIYNYLGSRGREEEFSLYGQYDWEAIDLFQGIASNGRLNVLQWIYSLPRRIYPPSRTVEFSIGNCDLDMLKWVLSVRHEFPEVNLTCGDFQKRFIVPEYVEKMISCDIPVEKFLLYSILIHDNKAAVWLFDIMVYGNKKEALEWAVWANNGYILEYMWGEVASRRMWQPYEISTKHLHRVIERKNIRMAKFLIEESTEIYIEEATWALLYEFAEEFDSRYGFLVKNQWYDFMQFVMNITLRHIPSGGVGMTGPTGPPGPPAPPGPIVGPIGITGPMN